VEEAERTRQESLSEWIRESLPKALAFARSLEADRHAAEDVVHDCICRLLERKNRYDLPRDGFKLLLRSIANACIDRGRRASRIRWQTGSDVDCDAASVFVDRGSFEPYHFAVHKELATAVGEALRRLPLNQRAALELKSLGCSLSEIAEALEVSESHAGVLAHRARRALSQELGSFLRDA
jgi:RNA polymerase sigma-70 factor (ECF subfamily)